MVANFNSHKPEDLKHREKHKLLDIEPSLYKKKYLFYPSPLFEKL